MNKVELSKYPLISVLMAVHNTARFLPQAIESVLAETYSNFEFLLYDDMSTDDSSKIMAEYANQDPRIRIYKGRQKALSFAYILRVLVGESKGEYFTIPDSDDICLPDRLQSLVNHAVKNPSASIVFGWHRMVDEKCVKTLQLFGEPVWPFKYFVDGFVHPGASLISKKYYGMTEGFDDGIRWSADRDLYLKMLERAHFSHIRKVVYIYRRHMASWTFARPDDYDALSIIREKAVKRNITIVRRYLEKGKTGITYNEYTALSYLMAYFAIDILGQYRNNTVTFDSLANKLGVTYRSFQRLKHNVSLAEVRNIDQLRNLIAKQTEKIKSERVTRLFQCYYNKRQIVFSKAKKILSVLKNKKQMKKSEIYILSTDTNVPTGGIKQLYRHVDILNNNGFNASIVHSKSDFRCTWFENDTKIAYLERTKMEKSDYLVVPEIYGELFSNKIKLEGLNGKVKEFISLSRNTVIFNQCCYLSFNGYSIAEDDINPFWLSNSVIATIVVSEDSRQYMHYVFPKIRTFRIHNAIDPRLFSYQHEKKKQICFMTRKLPDDVTQVVNILKYRNSLGDFKLIPIENKTEQEVAKIMKDSLIFLSFSYQEGCPLPPMEAMMCGCLVIGYEGRGGREYINNELSYPIEGRDIISFAKTVEEVISYYNINHNVFDGKRQKASEYVRKTYSPEKETEEILGCWRQIITKSDTQG